MLHYVTFLTLTPSLFKVSDLQLFLMISLRCSSHLVQVIFLPRRAFMNRNHDTILIHIGATYPSMISDQLITCQSKPGVISSFIDSSSALRLSLVRHRRLWIYLVLNVLIRNQRYAVRCLCNELFRLKTLNEYVDFIVDITSWLLPEMSKHY